jgi:pimeloyl-ACP methyl ester carboxylesterase
MRTRIDSGAWVEHEDVGTGPTLVFLHAFPFCRHMWEPQVRHFQDEFRLIVPDLPGFGGSSGFVSEPSIDQIADNVASLLDALGILGAVTLAGLSMGGYAALAFARRHPQRLRALILANTRAEPDDETAKANRNRLIADAVNKTAAEIFEPMLPRMVSPITLSQRPELVAEIRRLVTEQTPQAIVAATQALRDRPDARPFLARMTVPTLVISGQDDVITPPPVLQSLAAGIPSARLETIPDAGHLTNLEQPARFNKAVTMFLRSLQPAPI